MTKRFTLTLLLSASGLIAFAQDDLFSLLDSVQPAKKREPVYATFKTTKVISAQSTETVKKNTLDFRVTHRFGNIGAESNGGGHTFFGMDQSEDIRTSFDYGITDNITIGLGRSKFREIIDGMVKYRFLTQTSDNKVPVSIAYYGDAAISPQRKNEFYSGTVNIDDKIIHRLSYVNQLVIARKFSSGFSFEILPTYQHRNFVLAFINASNGAVEDNGLFALGAAARLKITKRIAFVADYFWIFSEYRQGNLQPEFHNPLALGIEIETGGHVFHLNFTNASGIIENNFLPYTTDDWRKGGFKFGFNISRVFSFGKKKNADWKKAE